MLFILRDMGQPVQLVIKGFHGVYRGLPSLAMVAIGISFFYWLAVQEQILGQTHLIFIVVVATKHILALLVVSLALMQVDMLGIFGHK
jgi:hypothetical protein